MKSPKPHGPTRADPVVVLQPCRAETSRRCCAPASECLTAAFENTQECISSATAGSTGRTLSAGTSRRTSAMFQDRRRRLSATTVVPRAAVPRAAVARAAVVGAPISRAAVVGSEAASAPVEVQVFVAQATAATGRALERDPRLRCLRDPATAVYPRPHPLLAVLLSAVSGPVPLGPASGIPS